MSNIIDVATKEYNYLSRYASVPLYYNKLDKKTYYGTSNQLNKEITSYSLYTVKKNDTLDSISLTYYNTPLYWWIIADINSIQDSLIPLEEGRLLLLPSLSDVEFVEVI